MEPITFSFFCSFFGKGKFCYWKLFSFSGRLPALRYLSQEYSQYFTVTINGAEWAPKNGHFRTAVLEKTLKNPLDSKEIKPINPKGNQSWKLIGRTDAEAEAPILWPLMQRADSLEKTLRLGKIEGRRKRGRQRMNCLNGITEWTWVCANIGREWRTGKPGMLWSMERVRRDRVTEQQWQQMEHNL